MNVAASSEAGTGPRASRDRPGPGSSAEADRQRRQLGGLLVDVDTLSVLPDDPEELADAVAADGRPFNGALVPLVIHQPHLAERSFDASEWAAELIRGAGGGFLVVSPCAELPDVGDFSPGADEVRLTARQWNHTVAMLERLTEVCRRFGLEIGVGEAHGRIEIGPGSALADRELFPYLLDTGRFLVDGLVPRRLVSPAGWAR